MQSGGRLERVTEAEQSLRVSRARRRHWPGDASQPAVLGITPPVGHSRGRARAGRPGCGPPSRLSAGSAPVPCCRERCAAAGRPPPAGGRSAGARGRVEWGARSSRKGPPEVQRSSDVRKKVCARLCTTGLQVRCHLVLAWWGRAATTVPPSSTPAAGSSWLSSNGASSAGEPSKADHHPAAARLPVLHAPQHRGCQAGGQQEAARLRQRGGVGPHTLRC